MYRAYAEEYDLPLFYQPWFLDVACGSSGGAWDVILATSEGGEILGVWPYFLKSKYGFKTLTLPPLTPFLGPLMTNTDDTHVKPSTRRSKNRKILRDLIGHLPSASRLIVQTPPMFDNWRPLSWKGFHQTTRYTLRIDLRKRKEELEANLRDRLRNHISQARKVISISTKGSSKDLYDLSEQTFAKQRLSVPYGYNTFCSIYDASIARDQGFCFIGHEQEIPKAGLFVGRDHNTAYLLVTGRSHDAHNGAVALLIWESMMHMKELGVEIFDFEGSMIEPIATFFDGFGGELVPYHRLTKTKTKGHRLIFELLGKI